MTTISLLGGDFELLFDDETVGANAVAGMRMLRRSPTAPTTTVYTTNALYSAVAADADAFQAMGFTNPMLPVTPNAYTMENKYFIPRSSTEFLKEGAIEANWAVVSGDGVFRKVYTTVTVAPVAADIGRQVTEATSLDTGTLLDFEVEPDGTTVVWIRPDAAGDAFALSTALTTTGDGGTMNVLGSGAAISGISLWPSIQAIGSVPAATEVYLYQSRFKMTDTAGAFQWWTTDTTVSLGIIDILIRTTNAGVVIAGGDVEVFGRRYTSLYDQFRLNVAAGGRSALPLASSPDINNTTGYRQFTGSVGVSDFDVGNYIYVGATFATATKKGVLTKVAGTIVAPILDYYLIGDLTDFAASDAVKEFDPATQLDGDGTCTAAAPIAAPGGPTDGGAAEGGSVTITLGTTTRDHDGDAVAEPYSVIVDALTNVPIAKVYERIKYVTRRGATAAELFGAGVNVPGESYRGIEAQVQYDGPVGVFGEGEDVDVLATGFTARAVSVNTTDTYVMLTDQQTSLIPLADNDVLRDEALDTVTVMGAPIQFVSPKQSPLGTFTGTQIFGARGIDFRNPAAADTQAYILTDDNGALRNPPNTVSFTVTNTAAGDRVFAARDTGLAGVIDKDQFGGLAVPAGLFNGLADLVIRAAGTVDSEVPTTGFVRVVDTGLQEEHHYVYDSRTAGALGEFTLRNVNEGTGITTASSTQIIDTTATFLTAPVVEVGMLVRNTFAGKTTHVWEVTNVVGATVLDVVALYGPLDATQDWDVGDTYTINALIGDHTIPGDYSTADDVFDLILDQEVTGASINNSFVKILSVDFGVVVNVRQGKIILPFTQNQTQGDGNTIVTVVRAPDTIAV